MNDPKIEKHAKPCKMNKSKANNLLVVDICQKTNDQHCLEAGFLAGGGNRNVQGWESECAGVGDSFIWKYN